MTMLTVAFRNITNAPENERRLPTFRGKILAAFLSMLRLFLYAVLKILLQPTADISC
jgi:hypothetical protein